MLPETLRAFISRQVATSTFQIDREAIRRFADAVGDMNPLYWDERYARKSRHGGMIAPPGLICTPWYNARPEPWASRQRESEAASSQPDFAAAGYARVLDGGMEFEFLKEVRAGDIISSRTVVKDMVEKEGRMGKMLLMTRETLYADETGAQVARVLWTSIHIASNS